MQSWFLSLTLEFPNQFRGGFRHNSILVLKSLFKQVKE